MSKKEKFYVKRKNNTQTRFFFQIFCRMDTYFKRLIIFVKVESKQNEYKQH